MRPAAASAAPLLLWLSACQGQQNVLDPGGPDARQIAELAWWMFAAATLILIVTLGVLGVAIAMRGGRLPVRGAAALVLTGGVIAPIAAILAVAISGVAIGDQTEGERGADGPLIEVHGERWWWEFRYLDEDGQTVAVTANEFWLPVGRRARLRLLSDNVIHSFWLPNLQGKTDMIPGRVNTLFLEPEAPGRWRGQCAEFCGLQHALMGVVATAVPEPEFRDWLARQAAPAAVTAGRGLDVFMELGCGECHAIRGTAADGQEGPDLTHFGSRETIAAATLPNTRGHLGGWITGTQHVKPGVLMPPYAPAPEDLHALLDFLEALE